MKVVILAAGLGTRLRPITDDRPKCMVALCGATVLERQLTQLCAVGIHDVTLVVGHRADQVHAPGARVVPNPAYARTNMVASLFCATDVLDGSSDVIVSYGDIVYEARVLRALLACRAPVALVVDRAWRRYWEQRMPDPLADAETLELDSKGRVLSLGQKTRSYEEIQGQYIGLFKVRADHVPQLLEVHARLDRNANYDGRDFENMYMTTFLQQLINEGWTVQSVPIQNGWLEIDSLQDLALYERMHAEGTLDAFCAL